MDSFFSRKILWSALLASIFCAFDRQAAAQTQDETLHPQHLIDLPTAHVLPKGSGSMEMRISANGGLLGGIYAGIAERLILGISFGGTNLIGTGKTTWNPRPEVAIKYLMVRENDRAPNVAIGFESQGYGPYDDNLNRYQVKSRGFYAAVSRKLNIAGTLEILGGMNYSVENKDKDSRLSAFLGAQKSINDHLSILAEYDFARNDNLGLLGYGADKGYMNVGVRVVLGGNVGLAFDLRNILDNRIGSAAPTRELKIMYAERLDF